MDPINNPIPTSTPVSGVVPTPEPVSGVAPTPSAEPVASVESADSISSVSQVKLEPSPALARPTAPGASVITPTAAPVNPIIQPTGSPVQPPINPIVRPSGLGVTDPIMMPERPAAPDPVEEELKAPMKAAAPVPGSIGSAVSGPADSTDSPMADGSNPFANSGTAPTPSVAFNDPATQPIAANGGTNKPKTKKKTLIALIIIASMIVVALAAILIMQMNGISIF